MKTASLRQKIAACFSVTFLSCCLLLSPLVYAKNAPRIISAGAGVTELIVALDAEAFLVGTDSTSQHFLSKNVPTLGYQRQLSAEGALALSPTHLLGSDDVGPQSSLDLLKAANVKVEIMPSGDSLEDFNQRIDKIAQLTHTQAKAERIKQEVQQSIQTLRHCQPSKKVSALFIMMSKGRPITVAGNQTTINQVIELAGGINPVATQFNSYKPYSIESIVKLQPDYILLSDRTLAAMGGVKGLVEAQPMLAATPAIKNNKIISFPSYSILGGSGLTSLKLAQRLQQDFYPNQDAASCQKPTANTTD
jgi:iron complex transport system substrate-binding protein